MQQSFGEYEISDDRTRIDIARIHGWLTKTYWNEGCTQEYVRRAFEGSQLVLGAYLEGCQVACMRLVTDGITFAWVSDVYVDESHRGKGLSKALMNFALQHPDFQDMKRWLLATRSAHGLYEALGFTPLRKPQNFLVKERATV